MSCLCALAVIPTWAASAEAADSASSATTGGEQQHNAPAGDTLVVSAAAQSSQSSDTDSDSSWAAGEMHSATGLSLTPRETPQSTSVVTRQRMDDLQLNSINDVLANTTGVSSTTLDSERVNYYARGFRIRNFQYDGVPTTPISGDYTPGEGVLDTAFYERVEVVRGAAGLLQGTGDPSAAVNLIRKRPLWTFAATGSASAGSWNNHRSMLGKVRISGEILLG
ncbi:TonB-dependent receptor plug domain-containing protein [Shimwellia pseudoproteus]|uniref:TonB-dependent siderophore receptor n=1 Tax=Shimwellia pseudoproteus TaxID=570012 RepID=UPI0018EA55DB|nr:TonB-dependent receptor plug domain-containing protein [Shimwellia pseudoproteus]MBJ3814727.1 TonB-dependent receptor plug domain-containing protein [Shimwellia pseudoproteus]